MSNSGFAAFDALIFGALKQVGMGDAAIYNDGGSPVSCTVIVDRDVQVLGEYGQVVGQKTSISFLRAEVPAPVRGATVTVGSDTWTLESKSQEDESASEWIVNDG